MKNTHNIAMILLLFAAKALAQATPASGIVTDHATGQGMPGVSIIEKGTTNGTTTDFDGNFSINVMSANAVLEFIFLGYQTLELKAETNMKVQMSEQISQLEDVVVVGFGTQKKVNLTGSVTTVESKQLGGIPATNLSNMIQGRMPGVLITQPSGQPGREGSTIRVRGLGTINNSNPMVIVDGLETTMNDINPNDVESMSVLKDAAASAIYGTRAANGVILVTTKRGKEGTTKVSYSSYGGVQRAIRLPRHPSSYDYATLLNEGLSNEGRTAAYTPAEVEAFRTGEGINTNWLDLMLKGSGLTQNHNVNISGGSANTQYNVSLGYYDQEGLMKYTNTDRLNARINLDTKIYKWLKFGISSAASRQETVVPTTPALAGQTGVDQFFRMANRIPPTRASQTPDGRFIKSHTDGNPIAWLEAGGNERSINTHVLGSAFFEVTPLEGLSIKAMGGLDFTLLDRRNRINVVEYPGGGGAAQGPNSKRDSFGRTLVSTLQLTADYAKTIGEHDFKILLGAARQSNEYFYSSAYRRDFASNSTTDLDAGSLTGMQANGNSDLTHLGSFFGRINYSYAGKYLFEANARYDRSSKFSAANRAAIFPSFSAGWRVSEESFMKKIDWLNNLKIRASWGQLGNHQIDSYQYLPQYASGQGYPFGGVVSDGVLQNVASNPNLRWERTTEWDLGVDFSIKNGLFGIEADYYNRYTDDILARPPIAASFGLDAPYANLGAMSNQGVEVRLTHGKTFGDFSYNVSAYGTYNLNRVEKYPNPSTGSTVRRVGDPWDAFFGYKNIGKFASDQEAATLPNRGVGEKAGDLRYQDLNGDGKISTDNTDKVVIGPQLPVFTYGLTLDLNYKWFDFSVFFQGVADVYRTINDEMFFGFGDGSNNGLTAHLDRTIVENGQVVREGYYPIIRPNTYNINNETSTFTVLRADYVRLKNIQLGYTFPKKFFGNVIDRIRLYASAQNLLTITGFTKDADPETSNAYASYAYPQVQFYTFGLNVTF